MVLQLKLPLHFPVGRSLSLDVGLTWIKLSPSLIGLQTAQQQMTSKINTP